jgi:hypothetical protein
MSAARRTIPASSLPVQPVKKLDSPVKILPNLTGLRTDQQLDQFILKHRNDTVSKIYDTWVCCIMRNILQNFDA